MSESKIHPLLDAALVKLEEANQELREAIDIQFRMQKIEQDIRELKERVEKTPPLPPQD